MKKQILYLIVTTLIIFTFLMSCNKKSATEPESTTYDASGLWTLTFTQTNIVDGNYIECGTDPVLPRSFEIIQNGSNVSIIDNEDTTNGTVNGTVYTFSFREQKNDYNKDYIDFRLQFNLKSDTSCTGSYRMEDWTFFEAYNDSFFCITQGTFTGSTPSKPGGELETGTVTDIDGNIYQTIKIGTQWWMAENLKVKHYRNGNNIPNVTDNSGWANLSYGGYCSYKNDVGNLNTYGLLYNWYAVDDSRGLAPQGWHIPTIDEWETLINYLGGFSVAGGKMKEEGTSYWDDPNVGATNESGFNGVPGGYRWDNGTFTSLGTLAYFYSSSQFDNTHGKGKYLYSGDTKINGLQLDKKSGFSIRCVKD